MCNHFRDGGMHGLSRGRCQCVSTREKIANKETQVLKETERSCVKAQGRSAMIGQG